MSLDINLTNVESTTNKSTNVNTDQASNTKYPSVKAVFDWANSAISWIATNGANVLSHLSNTNNPHSTTATQVDALKRDGSNANSDVNLDTFGLDAKFIKIKGTAGNGHLNLKHQSSASTAGGSESVLYADNSGNPKWKNDGNAVQNVMLENAPITPGTYHKVTVDEKGLVTAGDLSYQMMFGNPNLSLAGSLTRYFSFSEGSVQTTSPPRYIPFMQNVTVSRFFITTISTQPASGSFVFTIQKNGVDTGIVITIPAGSSAGSYSELVTSVSFNAGDNISIKAVNNSPSTSCTVAGVSIGFL